MKVLFITNIPSPYRVEFFNELGKYCDLTVLFEKKNALDRDASWQCFEFKHFEGIFLEGIRIGSDSSFCPNVITFIKKENYDNIVVCNFSTPTGWLEIMYMKCKNIPYIIESDGGFAGTGTGFKEKFKRFLLKDAKAYFSTAAIHDEYYMQYGAQLSRIYRYPFTSVKEEDVLSEPLEVVQKKHIRERLDISENKVIISVGSFIHRKGFDVLLYAISKLTTPVAVYIIGGEATEQMKEIVTERKIKNIYFLPFLSHADLKHYYLAADLFVLPTREDIWGLVINEAIAMGLPVITTNKCIAGLELVKEGENGYLINTENVEELTNAIETLLHSDLKLFSEKSIEIAKQYTIEEMVRCHLKILNDIKNRSNS